MSFNIGLIAIFKSALKKRKVNTWFVGAAVKQAASANFVGMEATVQPTEVSESSTAQQRTLCVNLKKEGRGFILNHVVRDEGGLV